MSDKITVNPDSIRGLGDIVSPKIVSDFDVFNVKLSTFAKHINFLFIHEFRKKKFSVHLEFEKLFFQKQKLSISKFFYTLRTGDFYSK